MGWSCSHEAPPLSCDHKASETYYQRPLILLASHSFSSDSKSNEGWKLRCLCSLSCLFDDYHSWNMMQLVLLDWLLDWKPEEKEQESRTWTSLWRDLDFAIVEYIWEYWISSTWRLISGGERESGSWSWSSSSSSMMRREICLLKSLKKRSSSNSIAAASMSVQCVRVSLNFL